MVRDGRWQCLKSRLGHGMVRGRKVAVPEVKARSWNGEGRKVAVPEVKAPQFKIA